MQSLRQAVYRYVCKCSRDNGGVARRVIVKEMRDRGYLEPIQERVNGALQDYINMRHIVLRRSRFVHVPPSKRTADFRTIH